MRRVYRSLTVPKIRRQAICQSGVWPFRVVRKAGVRTSASPSDAHASHEGLNDRNAVVSGPSVEVIGESIRGRRGASASLGEGRAIGGTFKTAFNPSGAGCAGDRTLSPRR